MSEELVVKNAKIVTPHEVVEGTVVVCDGRIAEVRSGNGVGNGAVDFGGDYLIPGLVDLHTDNVERHIRPRSGAEWPVCAALLAHDAQMISAGITTVFDSLFVGSPGGSKGPWMDERSSETLKRTIGGQEDCRASGAFRAEHLIHLRTEMPLEDVPLNFASVYKNAAVKLVSLMDHTPGQRQLASKATYLEYAKKFRGRPVEELEREFDELKARQEKYAAPNRAKILEMLDGHDVALASHDDGTVEEVEQAHADGVTICEFPTTVEAAEAARSKGMHTVAGSPNIVLGRSQSGNVSVQELVKLGVMDALASDYVPHSMLHAPFLLAERLGISIADAIRMVTAAPAKMVGLNDRGSIEPGMRADMVRVKMAQGLPVALSVWREGRLV